MIRIRIVIVIRIRIKVQNQKVQVQVHIVIRNVHLLVKVDTVVHTNHPEVIKIKIMIRTRIKQKQRIKRRKRVVVVTVIRIVKEIVTRISHRLARIVTAALTNHPEVIKIVRRIKPHHHHPPAKIKIQQQIKVKNGIRVHHRKINIPVVRRRKVDIIHLRLLQRINTVIKVEVNERKERRKNVKRKRLKTHKSMLMILKLRSIHLIQIHF